METSPLINLKNFDDFISACNYFGIEVNNNQLEQFKKYYNLLLEWNEKINLISRRGIDTILEKHFLDSIVFLPEIELIRRGVACNTPTIFDIGSGGGFPAIPLAIMKSEWGFTLCESVKKKANFLTSLANELKLKNVKIENNRVEALHARTLHKNKYDFVTVRAIGKLDELIKLALPLLKKDGYLLAYKAKDIDKELNAINKLNLQTKIYTKEINGVVRNLVATGTL